MMHASQESGTAYRTSVAYLANGEPVFCIYCPPQSYNLPPFTGAIQAQRDIFGLSLELLERAGQTEELAEGHANYENMTATPIPEDWKTLHLPAKRAFRVKARTEQERSICVAGYGANKASFQRAMCLATAVAGIVQRRWSGSPHWLERDVQVQRIIAEMEVMANRPAQAALWDDDCWFASTAEMRGYCARLRKVVELGSIGQHFEAHQVKEILEMSGLPKQDLSDICELVKVKFLKWTLCGLLCAMALAARRKKGMTLPETLPNDLYAVAQEVALNADCAHVASDQRETDANSSDEEEEYEEEEYREEQDYDRWTASAIDYGVLPEYPWMKECKQFLANELSHHVPTVGTGLRKIWIPVMCLRWTHDGIQGNLSFKDGSPVISLILYLWRNGYSWTNSVPALDVVLDNHGYLWCMSNRRLAAYRMLQCLSEKTVWAECYLSGPQNRKFAHAKTTKNGGIGVVPNYSSFAGSSRGTT